jgi:hypothetical protein
MNKEHPWSRRYPRLRIHLFTPLPTIVSEKQLMLFDIPILVDMHPINIIIASKL